MSLKEEIGQKLIDLYVPYVRDGKITTEEVVKALQAGNGGELLRKLENPNQSLSSKLYQAFVDKEYNERVRATRPFYQTYANGKIPALERGIANSLTFPNMTMATLPMSAIASGYQDWYDWNNGNKQDVVDRVMSRPED